MFLQAAASPAGDLLQNFRLSRFRSVRSAKSRPQRAANRLVYRRTRWEIERFQLALNSYVARFAEDPNITFEMHCRSVMADRSGR
jgi:hypothetical protein